ncbi:MAG: hypothetical protein PHN49_12760, partial [Candidatus Omnitrophica bacterium]|nr:hypothetical protein [Candidatus Omnitrophota bacterium]
MSASQFFKIFRIILFAVFVVCVAGIVFVCVVFSSPQVMQQTIMSGANTFLKDISLRDLVIESQACYFPKEFIFAEVSGTLERDKEIYEFRFEAIQLSDILKLIFFQDGTTLEIRNGSLKASSFRLDGLDAQLRHQDQKQWSGPVSVSEAESQGLHAANIRAQIVIKSKEVAIPDISADAYQGKVAGNGYLYFLPSAHYAAQGVLEGIDTKGMEEVHPSLFSQIHGRISGMIEIQGQFGGIEHAQLDVGLGKDGEIQAALLESLLAYIPQSVQKQNLAVAIQNNSRVRLKDARLKLADQDSETVSADIQFQSEELNLDVNLIVDIIV